MLQMGKTMSAEVKWKADCMSSSCQGLCSEHLNKEQDSLALVCVYSQLSLFRKDLYSLWLLPPPLTNMFLTTFRFLSALPIHLETFPLFAQPL